MTTPDYSFYRIEVQVWRRVAEDDKTFMDQIGDHLGKVTTERDEWMRRALLAEELVRILENE